MSAEDLRLAAWAADAWVVYMPPTFADSEMGIHGRYVTVLLPPIQGGRGREGIAWASDSAQTR